MTPEQKARQQIDAMLVASGWVIQNYKSLNLSAGRGIALREVPLKSGRCDYLLLVDRVPVGVVEAKKEGITLSTVADQSGHYAENLPDFLEGGTCRCKKGCLDINVGPWNPEGQEFFPHCLQVKEEKEEKTEKVQMNTTEKGKTEKVEKEEEEQRGLNWEKERVFSNKSEL